VVYLKLWEKYQNFQICSFSYIFDFLVAKHQNQPFSGKTQIPEAVWKKEIHENIFFY
jgi:hypothetical protein